jgi:hypothetical protein
MPVCDPSCPSAAKNRLYSRETLVVQVPSSHSSQRKAGPTNHAYKRRHPDPVDGIPSSYRRVMMSPRPHELRETWLFARCYPGVTRGYDETFTHCHNTLITLMGRAGLEPATRCLKGSVAFVSGRRTRLLRVQLLH